MQGVKSKRTLLSMLVILTLTFGLLAPVGFAVPDESHAATKVKATVKVAMDDHASPSMIFELLGADGKTPDFTYQDKPAPGEDFGPLVNLGKFVGPYYLDGKKITKSKLNSYWKNGQVYDPKWQAKHTVGHSVQFTGVPEGTYYLSQDIGPVRIAKVVVSKSKGKAKVTVTPLNAKAVTKASATIYKSAKANSKKIATAKKGTPVKITSEKGSWYKILHKGKTAYIKKSDTKTLRFCWWKVK